MDLVVTKIKPDEEKSEKAVVCQLYEACKITKPNVSEEERFKKAIAAINPKIGIAALAPNTLSEMVQTKYGGSPIGSTNSYQLSYTEANSISSPVYVTRKSHEIQVRTFTLSCLPTFNAFGAMSTTFTVFSETFSWKLK